MPFDKRLGAEGIHASFDDLDPLLQRDGSDCRLEFISPVAHSTVKYIVIFDPFDITKQFSKHPCRSCHRLWCLLHAPLSSWLFFHEETRARKNSFSSSSDEAPLEKAVKRVLRHWGTTPRTPQRRRSMMASSRPSRQSPLRITRKDEDHLPFIPFPGADPLGTSQQRHGSDPSHHKVDGSRFRSQRSPRETSNLASLSNTLTSFPRHLP